MVHVARTIAEPRVNELQPRSITATCPSLVSSATMLICIFTVFKFRSINTSYAVVLIFCSSVALRFVVRHRRTAFVSNCLQLSTDTYVSRLKRNDVLVEAKSGALFPGRDYNLIVHDRSVQ